MRRVLVGCVRTSTCDILRPCNNQIRPSGLLKQKALPAVVYFSFHGQLKTLKYGIPSGVLLKMQQLACALD